MSVNIYDQENDTLVRIAGGTLYSEMPVGSIIPFGGSVIPSGYLLCNGAEVLKTAYAELYAVIGDAFGTASVNTKFVLPDLREAVPKGAGLSGKSSVHYDSDGVALGEFVEDRIQDHRHEVSVIPQSGGSQYIAGCSGGAISKSLTDYVDTTIATSTRKGATTEVKAVGANYIIKAKQIAAPADFKDAIDDTLNEFAKSISLVPLNNSSINYDKSRIVGGIVTICADIIIQSGSYLTKENAIANVPNLGTASVGYILPCLYRNTANGAEEPSFAIIQTAGNLYPYYTKTEYNEIRINASYSCKI